MQTLANNGVSDNEARARRDMPAGFSLVAAGYETGLRLYWACPWEARGEPLGPYPDPFAAVDAAYNDILAREG